ncbi:MAG TPA: NAD(P)/FAD-dependent oxidoreductase [Verrucomicrobiae bacterium]|jgi:monoamine oxidase|nr:NAD(P)/FAD-dependent oxidoreductase [Verrucomicrobiae bacterium]
MTDVIVVGAGAAGLAAAYRLARAGMQVLVLEARDRAGGRILTIPSGEPASHFELGAEFIHGTRHAIHDLAEEAGWRVADVKDAQWVAGSGGRLFSARALYDNLARTFENVDLEEPDVSLDEYLHSHPVPDEWFQRQFVEGFDAANVKNASVHTLAQAETSDEDGEDKDFRLQGGYHCVIDWLQAGLEAAGGAIEFGSPIQMINWREGGVEVIAQTAQGRRIFQAHQAVITVPCPILQSSSDLPGGIRFTPPLREKERALSLLEMGHVVKINLRFQNAFWKHHVGCPDFGFIHARKTSFHTWWSRPGAPVLVGWTGGPRAAALDRGQLLHLALEDLHTIFGIATAEVRRQLLDWRCHDWSADPYARGAYTYTLVDGGSAAEELAEPLAGTLFFAGEATAPRSAQGTVHGAIASGFRAADQALQVLCHNAA